MCCWSRSVSAQRLSSGDKPYEEPIMLRTPDCDLQGTLYMPAGDSVRTVVLIVSGSGSADRDGNKTMMRNNALRMYAYALANQNIASVRFDKRGVGASKPSSGDKNSITLSKHISDVDAWIRQMHRDRRFQSVIVAGHSEGALLALAAVAQGAPADALISISGMGRSASDLLKDQLSHQPTQIREIAYDIIDTLSQGRRVDNVPIFLQSLFNPAAQSHLMSLFKIDPQNEIRQITIPILLLHGGMDVEVKVDDARLLKAANVNARIVIIHSMNHVLKDCPNNIKADQVESYVNPAIPINRQLIHESVRFVRSL